MNHIKPIATDPVVASNRFSNTLSPVDFAHALDLSVHDSIKSIKKDWKKAEKNSIISVYQRYDWVESYLKTRTENEDIRPFIIVGKLEDEIVFILPLVLKGNFITRIKFIGGTHVNFNMGIFPKTFADLITPDTFKKIFCRIQKLTPGLGYLALCCQPVSWQGQNNPLMYEPHQRASNPAFFLDLSGGFEATLARGNAKRKRKKFRQQCRQVETYGGYELVKPGSQEEAAELVDTFLKQKSQRLNTLGIRDVFSGDHIRTFLIDLASKSLGSKNPVLQLYGLKIGNEIAAVFGAGSTEKHLSGYFSSIDSKFSEISPGEMLLYLTVEDACNQGYQHMDLGAGDERYKRSWSTEVVDMYEIFMPYNLFGLPVVWLRRLYGAVRRIIRENDKSWNFYKKLRMQKARFLN